MKEAIDIATKEINWHESYHVDGPGDEYKRGFINGLYHLRNLFTAVVDASQPAVEADAKCHFCGKKLDDSFLRCDDCVHAG